jgi:hypothetical protein
MPGLLTDLRWGLANFLPRLASNFNKSSHLCLPRSWDYRHVLPCLASPSLLSPFLKGTIPSCA